MVIILGLGFTGQRLARRLLRQGVEVWAAVRNPQRFQDFADAGLKLSKLGSPSVLPKHAMLIDLIPPLPEPENTMLRTMIAELEPTRVIYISSTGVYGDQVDVDQTTPVKPSDERGRRRLDDERWVSSGPWSSLILRAAAIYGPGRGVHAAVREGKIPRGAGSGIVSRVHVEDLAAIIATGILSDLEGAWPVADDAPCSSAEIIAWCAGLFGKEQVVPIQSESAITGRRVDGTAIREKLGVQLVYPSWEAGIPASLAEEEKIKLSGH